MSEGERCVCVLWPSFKKGVFLNIPFRRNSADAAELLAVLGGGFEPEGVALVRQAAKGSRISAERNIKKHLLFFRWVTDTALPLAHEGNRVGGAGRHDGCDSGVYPGEGSWYGEVSFR